MLNLLCDKLKQITNMLSASMNQNISLGTVKKIKEYFNKLKPKIKQIFSKSLPNQSLDKDCYKPIKNKNSAFNGNYIEYESKGDKDKKIVT